MVLGSVDSIVGGAREPAKVAMRPLKAQGASGRLLFIGGRGDVRACIYVPADDITMITTSEPSR